jgi:PBSX family phage terminase large subunit
MKQVIEMARPYERILTTDKTTVVMYSPRISGKSFALGQTVYLFANKYPKHDIVVTRAHYNSLEDSLYNEIISFAESNGTSDFYYPLKSPLRIKTRKGNTIFFKGIGGSDYSRSKGFKGTKPLSLIICDEAQQLKDEQSLRQAIATFIRSVDSKIQSRIIIAGNPEMVKAHWWNAYCRKYRFADVYEFIDANYLSIKKYLSPVTLEEIENERKYNPQMYKFLYLGELNDLAGGAYAQFKRDKHYISVSQWQRETAGQRLCYIIWGGDGAITKDSTGIIPIAVYSNGRGYVLERFYYNPQETGIILAPSQITEMIIRYVDEICERYDIYEQNVGSYFAIDCAAADLITQLRYQIYGYHIVKGFTQKNIINNNAVVNNCFAKNMIKIVDFGGYNDFYYNRFVPTTVDTEPLIYQLESVVWKDYKLDPTIPNDYTDALTYGVNVYFNNPDNLYLPERKGAYD